jgi:hypothetical protein
MGSVGLKKASEVGMSQEECLESEAQEAYEPSNSELLEVLAAEPPADNGGSPVAPWGAPGGSPGGQPGGRPGGAGGAIGGDLSAVAELALPDWARDLDDEAAEGISEGLSLGWGAMVDLGSAARKEAVDAGKVALVENKDVKGMKRSAGEWSTSWVTGGPSADDPAVKAKVDAQTRDIPNQDIIYEQLAHGAAYGKFAPAQLAAWGYGPLERGHPRTLADRNLRRRRRAPLQPPRDRTASSTPSKPCTAGPVARCSRFEAAPTPSTGRTTR